MVNYYKVINTLMDASRHLKDPLSDLARKYGSDKVFHRYTHIYYHLFKGIQNDVKKVIEIGILRGASLNMWKEFFPNAEILGVDKDPVCHVCANVRIPVIIGDATEDETIKEITKTMKNDVDIIIDDGSHIPNEQIKTFKALFPLLKVGGYYIVEDVDLTHVKGDRTAIDYFFGLINFENAEMTDPIASIIEYIKVHRYMIIIKKGVKNYIPITWSAE